MRANITTRTWLLLGGGLSLTLTLILGGLGSRPAAQEPPSTGGGIQSTTLDD